MEPDRLLPLLRLLLAPGMQSAAAARLLRVHGDDPRRVLAAPREVLASVRGVGPALASAVAAAPGTEEEAAREASRCRDLGVALLGPGDAGYPLPLLQTWDPPPLLWVRGAWGTGDAASVSVVGSRRATPYGVVQAA
ncbi:MAG: DNA-protecting protein DprA, partial [Planctomycetes bacterium]|nr:DNA-protecting protein DprA [Planctomycetota bacterium]